MQRAVVDPAWRSQLLVGITVLNWLHLAEADREDLTELINQLATPGQRRLRLHQRWAERDLAALERPDTHAPAHLRGLLAPRAAHTAILTGRHGSGRRVAWDLGNLALTASSDHATTETDQAECT